MSRRSGIALLVVALLLVGGAAGLVRGSSEEAPRRAETAARPDPPRPVSAGRLARAVTAEGIVEHLRALQRIARRSDGNRAAGTPGYTRSVDYVVGRLRAVGYRVRLQPVRFPYFDERERPRLSGVRAERREVTSIVYSAGGSAGGRVQAIEGLACRDSDFAGFRRGRVALVKRGICPFRMKAENAGEAGAAAVVVYDPEATSATSVIRATFGRPGPRVPTLLVSRRVGEAIAARPGVELRVRVKAGSGMRTASNVLAELPGRGRGPAVVAGAHLDSVTDGPGINDDGSGVGSLLEIAEQAARAPLKGRRRLRLAFWAAEELGIRGSRRYVRSLGRRPRRRVAAYLNLDMVGSRNAARLVYSRGGGRAGRMTRAAERALAARGVPAEGTAMRGGSDHTPFAAAGIPVAGLFSGGSAEKSEEQSRRWGGRAGRPFDACYHRRCDTVRGIDRRTLGQLADAAVAALGAAVRR